MKSELLTEIERVLAESRKRTDRRIGRNLRALRWGGVDGLTKTKQRELGEAMAARGFESWRHHQTISRVEKGERQLQADEIVALADVFGVHVSRLLAGIS